MFSARRGAQHVRGTRRLGVVTIAAVILTFATGCSDESFPAAPPRAKAIPSVPALQRESSPIADQYIITFTGDVGDVPGLAKKLIAESNGTELFTYTTALHGFAARLPSSSINGLSRNPHIASIEQDATVEPSGTQSSPDWGLDRIDQRPLPLSNSYSYGPDGSGVNIYIIDTGIRLSHSDFAGRVFAGYSAINDGLGAGDCAGHGTHVAGIAGGTVWGVAKKARLYSVRVFDCAGSGTNSGLLAGVDWVTKNHVGPSVANMSLGGAYSSTLNQAVANSIASGITYTIAAGNYAKDACTVSPASVTSAITVGSTKWDDTQASFSDFGSCVDLYAPGFAITSDYYTSDAASYVLSGTSMSAPFAAGAAALYLSQNPSATPSQVAAALTSNATQGVITLLGANSLNRLLYTGFLGGDSVVLPPPPPPSPPPPPPPPPPVDSPPTAKLSASCSKTFCAFDASGSTDDKGIGGYAWQFGDGSQTTSSPTSSMSHTYAPGSYTVKVTVSDTSGQTSVAQVQISVKRNGK